jgi:hypothetical protein
MFLAEWTGLELNPKPIHCQLFKSLYFKDAIDDAVNS